jgi:hypothetical protein
LSAEAGKSTLVELPLVQQHRGAEDFAEHFHCTENVRCSDKLPLHDRQTCEDFERVGCLPSFAQFS